MKQPLFKALPAGTILSSSIPTPSFADDIDDFIHIEMTKRKIPGLQLAVVRNNKIIK